MKPVTDIKEARKLPERDCYDIVSHKMPDGTIVLEIVLRELVAVEQDDNAIIAFVDADGKLKSVNYDSEGAYKTTLED